MPVIGYLTSKMDNRYLIAFGFAMFGAASLWFGEVNLSIGQWSFLWAILISGFGSGCVFVPLSTTSMAFLKNEEIGNASGLYNLFRNIGGSIGISVVNTIVTRHSQVHRTELAGSLNAARLSVQGAVQEMQHYLGAQGASPTTAVQQSYGLLNQALDAQARLWSYVDDFRYMALACFACVPLVFTLKKAIRKGPASAAH
jgi:DHA2 family multidrug resistance protein